MAICLVIGGAIAKYCELNASTPTTPTPTLTCHIYRISKCFFHTFMICYHSECDMIASRDRLLEVVVGNLIWYEWYDTKHGNRGAAAVLEGTFSRNRTEVKIFQNKSGYQRTNIITYTHLWDRQTTSGFRLHMRIIYIYIKAVQFRLFSLAKAKVAPN